MMRTETGAARRCGRVDRRILPALMTVHAKGALSGRRYDCPICQAYRVQCSEQVCIFRRRGFAVGFMTGLATDGVVGSIDSRRAGDFANKSVAGMAAHAAHTVMIARDTVHTVFEDGSM